MFKSSSTSILRTGEAKRSTPTGWHSRPGRTGCVQGVKGSLQTRFDGPLYLREHPLFSNAAEPKRARLRPQKDLIAQSTRRHHDCDARILPRHKIDAAVFAVNFVGCAALPPAATRLHQLSQHPWCIQGYCKTCSTPDKRECRCADTTRTLCMLLYRSALCRVHVHLPLQIPNLPNGSECIAAISRITVGLKTGGKTTRTSAAITSRPGRRPVESFVASSESPSIFLDLSLPLGRTATARGAVRDPDFSLQG